MNNAAMTHHRIPASHFNKRTLNALSKKGIALIGTQGLPDKDGSWLNQTTGYQVSDNGTGKVWTYLEVLDKAK